MWFVIINQLFVVITGKGIIIHYTHNAEKAPALESNLIMIQQHSSFVIESYNPMLGLKFEK